LVAAGGVTVFGRGATAELSPVFQHGVGRNDAAYGFAPRPGVRRETPHARSRRTSRAVRFTGDPVLKHGATIGRGYATHARADRKQRAAFPHT